MITEEEALAKAKTEWWKRCTPREIALTQLEDNRLCMPFNLFHKAVEDALGRPVYTCEFADPDLLLKELHGQVPKATLSDVLSKLPNDKPVIGVVV